MALIASRLPAAAGSAATVAALREGAALDDLAELFNTSPGGLAVAAVRWAGQEADAGRLTDVGHAEACRLVTAALEPRPSRRSGASTSA
jgi:hypothetical protein